MNVIIAGCGRMGAGLAESLARKANTVTVIDQSDLAFENLAPDFPGRVVEGDVLDLKVLQRAGIEKAEAFVAATESDSVNAVIGHLARTVFQITNVVVRNQEPRWKIVHDSFGFDSVGPATWGIQRLEELLYDDPLRLAYSDVESGVKIYRYIVRQDWQGRTLDKLIPQNQSRPLVISRAGKIIPTEPTLVLQAGDEIFLQASTEELEGLRSRLEAG